MSRSVRRVLNTMSRRKYSSRRKPIGRIVYVGPNTHAHRVIAARILWSERGYARSLGLEIPRWVSRIAKEVRS